MQEETIKVKIVLENQYKVDVGQDIDDLQLLMAKGDKGDKGDTGPANTLSIGTVTGGNSAAATITGTAPNQTLNLTLPKGDTGNGISGVSLALNDGLDFTMTDGTHLYTASVKGEKGDTGVSGLGALTLSTTDIGEGVTLAANTLYGVYE